MNALEQYTRWVTLPLLVLGLGILAASCGDGNGDNDTVLTGFSGVIIFGIIAYVIYRVVKKRT